ncbi:hypothetical protein Q9L58_008229 [Maublancomyces gigas]|uniref:PD-(D/E)XK nuclease-like domain-containing protein n=1 Tax=Discina gigas TaxID=1032678 RepID=A0ABR3GAA4_9PEZI
MPDPIRVVSGWLDIFDQVRSYDRTAARAPYSSSRDCCNDALDDIDAQQPLQLQINTAAHSPTPSHCRHSVLPNLDSSPPPVCLLSPTSRNSNDPCLPSSRSSNHTRPIQVAHCPQQPSPPSTVVVTHLRQQQRSGLISPGPPARLLVETCAGTLFTSCPAAKLPNAATASETRGGTSGPSSQVPGSATIADDPKTFERDLSSMIFSTGGKRKRSYPSQSIISASTDIRAKRRAMQRLSPPLSYVFAHTNYPPQFIALFIARFDIARIESGCIPWTPAVEALLIAHNPLAYYPPHARNKDISTADEPLALALATWAISVYTLIISCTEDKASWSAPVRQLLSVMPPTQRSSIPSPAVPCDQMLTKVDVTTKLTCGTVLLDYPTVKVDALVAFNPTHPELQSITRAVDRHGVIVNALGDAGIGGHVVLLGVEIIGPTDDAAPATAEYELGVWGAKTLEVARQLGINCPSDWCDVAVGLTVCGHTWSAYVVFWEWDEVGERSVVVYGPLEVASTVNLYGVFKLVAWMAQVNVWALEVLECWKRRVAGACERSLHRGMGGV